MAADSRCGPVTASWRRDFGEKGSLASSSPVRDRKTASPIRRSASAVNGPVAHQLTFAEAARRGIICDYKVVISVVTSGMVNDTCSARHDKARHVANQLALMGVQAIEASKCSLNLLDEAVVCRHPAISPMKSRICSSAGEVFVSMRV